MKNSTTHTNITTDSKKANTKRTDRDEKWNEREPLTGTPVTGNVNSNYNYRTSDLTSTANDTYRTSQPTNDTYRTTDTTNRNEKWNEYEPLTGVPVTGNIGSNYNYQANETTNMAGRNDLSSQADLNKNRRAYDTVTENTYYDRDSLGRNNLTSSGVEYTKENPSDWASSDKTTTRREFEGERATDTDRERVSGADKERRNRSYK